MGGMRGLIRGAFLAAVALGFLLILLSCKPTLPAKIGTIDFRAYWSASYLLRRGESSGDANLVLQVERDRTGWNEGYPMMAWNPPWLLTLLAPYTLVSFDRAVWWWIISNILIVFLSASLLWPLDAQARLRSLGVYAAPLVAFSYSPTLIAIIAGQVNTLVLGGLVGYLFFRSRGHEGLAGACLAFASVKPQLVYVTVPILLLESLFRGNRRALVGFLTSMLGLIAFVILLRPASLLEYGSTARMGDLLMWETPTLGGVLHRVTGWEWFKLSGVLVIPIAISLWWRLGKKWHIRTVVDLTLLLSVITAPFGWSYDFIVLLIPIMRVITWAADGALSWLEISTLIIVLTTADLLMYYERVRSPSEVYFAWIPFLIVAVYGFAWWRRAANAISRAKPVTSFA